MTALNKQEFISILRESLSGLPDGDVEERTAFYGEMIDDRLEDGLSEEDAVSEIGDPKEIGEQIISEFPFFKLVKAKLMPKRKLSSGTVIALLLGAPLWIPLVIAALSVVLSLYASAWAVVASLWAIDVALGLAFVPGSIAALVIFCIQGHTLTGIMMLGYGLVSGGLSIFVFFGCRAATRGLWALTKKTLLGIKYLCIGGRRRNG